MSRKVDSFTSEMKSSGGSLSFLYNKPHKKLWQSAKLIISVDSFYKEKDEICSYTFAFLLRRLITAIQDELSQVISQGSAKLEL